MRLVGNLGMPFWLGCVLAVFHHSSHVVVVVVVAQGVSQTAATGFGGPPSAVSMALGLTLAHLPDDLVRQMVDQPALDSSQFYRTSRHYRALTQHVYQQRFVQMVQRRWSGFPQAMWYRAAVWLIQQEVAFRRAMAVGRRPPLGQFEWLVQQQPLTQLQLNRLAVKVGRGRWPAALQALLRTGRISDEAQHLASNSDDYEHEMERMHTQLMRVRSQQPLPESLLRSSLVFDATFRGLAEAIRLRHHQTLLVFLEEGALLYGNPQGSALLPLARDLDTVRLLLRAGIQVNIPDAQGVPPLVYLLQRVRPSHELVRVLVQAGANLNQLDHRGQPPLLHMLRLRQHDGLRALLEAGADARQLVNGQASLLYYAAAQFHDAEAVRLLWNAAGNLRSSNGYTVVQSLRLEENEDGWQALVQAGVVQAQESREAQEPAESTMVMDVA